MAERITERPIVIIGGGMAGGNAAATLRDEGFPGPVVLISREPGVPFGRPPLSKTYLRSEEDLDGWYVRPPGWYADHEVELRSGVVETVDPAAHTVTLASGEELGYQKILIATGGRNRRLRVPGADLPGIHQNPSSVSHQVTSPGPTMVTSQYLVSHTRRASTPRSRAHATVPLHGPTLGFLRPCHGSRVPLWRNT